MNSNPIYTKQLAAIRFTLEPLGISFYRVPDAKRQNSYWRMTKGTEQALLLQPNLSEDRPTWTVEPCIKNKTSFFDIIQSDLYSLVQLHLGFDLTDSHSLDSWFSRFHSLTITDYLLELGKHTYNRYLIDKKIKRTIEMIDKLERESKEIPKD